MRLTHLLFPLIAALLIALPSHAQAQPPAALVVTIRDSNGAGISAATVSILDIGGQHELARTTTDSAGVAVFATLPTESIRVLVAGQLADGPHLYQPGSDHAGLSIDLTAPPTRLDLRVEPDGQVLPDPATMISPDPGLPAQLDGNLPIPIAPLAQPTAVAAAAPSPAASAEGTPTEANAGWWCGLGLLIVIAASIVALIAFRTRWGRV
jgi:hypothetical protein